MAEERLEGAKNCCRVAAVTKKNTLCTHQAELIGDIPNRLSLNYYFKALSKYYQ